MDATMQDTYTPLLLIPLLPLVGAIFNGLFGHRLPRGMAGLVASLLPIIAFGVALRAFLVLLRIEDPEARHLQLTLYTWISSGVLEVPLAFRFDQLTAAMALVVTGVGSLIHVYSTGYMRDDRTPPRYFAYLNLFTFAMLTLVMADNLLVMFIGWEGVGVCSYLLIGYWYEDMDKAIAGKKAFVVNRIGDFGFLVGFFLLFWSLQAAGGEATTTFRGLEDQAGRLADQLLFAGTWAEMHVVTAVCLLFFLGACGKSAQIPLYVWLPDAMAGPTPVSALIHAATMVTAGVYMVARLSFLYDMSPVAGGVVAGVGALTAFFAATIGLFQHDIKKVLAYSTVSQLGYMFVGVGVGAYSAGIFHLVTHAFFKGLLFLGAGSVIVALHHEQDIRKMGGLLKRMPLTGWTFLAAWVAILGVPGFSGFFSKDEILWAALETGHVNLWLILLAGAGLTAFYMTRLVVLVFFGEPRLTEAEQHHLPGGRIKDPGSAITTPLIILAVLSIAGGWIGIPAALGGGSHFHHFLEPALAAGDAGAGAGHHPFIGEYAAMGITLVVVLGSAALAWWIYSTRLAAVTARSALYLSGPEAGGLAGALYRIVNRKYAVDEIYDALVVRPVRYGSRDYLWPFDKWVVDGAVNIAAEVTLVAGAILGWVQNGNVKRYLVGMAVGVALVIAFLVIAAPLIGGALNGGM
jgi:NADH-quinone oxidoreductase subunit L